MPAALVDSAAATPAAAVNVGDVSGLDDSVWQNRFVQAMKFTKIVQQEKKVGHHSTRVLCALSEYMAYMYRYMCEKHVVQAIDVLVVVKVNADYTIHISVVVPGAK